jgi:hypothetical protein
MADTRLDANGKQKVKLELHNQTSPLVDQPWKKPG